MRKPPPEWGLLCLLLLLCLDEIVAKVTELLVVGEVDSGFVYCLSHVLDADLEPAFWLA